MTLQQLSAVKHWHVAHRREHPVEFHTWDAMLTFWLMGWVGVPAAAMVWGVLGVAVCALLFFAPTLYTRLRRRLHEQHKLRCDWLGAT